MPKTSIIIVNYNSLRYTLACIESIYKYEDNIEVIVVDNKSTESPKEQLLSNFPGVKYIQSKENSGFSHANNLGAVNANGEYLFFLNADTELKQPIIPTLIAQFKDNETGAVGCKLLNTDGTTQLNFHSGHRLFRKLYGRNPFFNKLFKSHRLAQKDHSNNLAAQEISEYVDWVSGAAILMKKEAFFDQKLQWDEDFFMYWEDVELCTRIRQSGLKVYYCSEVSLIHHGGSGEENFTSNRFNMMEQSKNIFLRKTKGSFVAWIYRALLKCQIRLELFFNRNKEISNQLQLEKTYYLDK